VTRLGVAAAEIHMDDGCSRSWSWKLPSRHRRLAGRARCVRGLTYRAPRNLYIAVTLRPDGGHGGGRHLPRVDGAKQARLRRDARPYLAKLLDSRRMTSMTVTVAPFPCFQPWTVPSPSAVTANLCMRCF